MNCDHLLYNEHIFSFSMGLENNQNKDKINEMMNNDGLTLSKAIEAVNQLKKIQGGQPMKILTKEEIRRLIEGEPNQ